MTQVKGRLRRSLSRWASSDDMEAKELQIDTVKAGCCPIADAADRERVELQGSLRTVTLRPRGGVPALEAELYDGSGVITLVWLGRRRIAGIEPGRSIKVEGRIGVHEKNRIMFNPRYELRS
ncbi:MAG TPA: OB-fold nucleic acid binding domain-containing protein [Nocardioidaceae bacterium]|nr:OB-fold nucleic acid binding domain-containing protein [Nocardioidaceae bacterium]